MSMAETSRRQDKYRARFARAGTCAYKYTRSARLGYSKRGPSPSTLGLARSDFREALTHQEVFEISKPFSSPMTSSRSNRSSDLALRLGPPVLQLSCHVPDRHIEQALTDQRQIIKVQTQLLERLKLRTQQRARHASFLASHIAIVGMIPKEPFRQSEHEFLWSHLQNIFKAEPLVFASNDRKRAFAFAHLDESWRRGYESYLDRGGRHGRTASAENNWKNLSKYIRSGRAWY